MEIHNSYFIIGQVFIASKILRNKPTQCYWRWLMLLTTSFSLTENIQDFITWDFDIFVMAVTHYLCTPGSNSSLEETTQSAKCSLLLWQSRSLLPTSPGASSQQSRMQRSMEEWRPGSWHKMRVSINVTGPLRTMFDVTHRSKYQNLPLSLVWIVLCQLTIQCNAIDMRRIAKIKRVSFCEGVKTPGWNKIEIIGHEDRPRRLRNSNSLPITHSRWHRFYGH